MERPWNRTVIRSKPRWALLLREQVVAGATLARAAVARRERTRQKFVVQSLGRSGSTLLTDLLSCHPQIACDGEILSHRLFITSPGRLVRDRAKLFPSRAYGFKMRPRHFVDQRIDDPASFLADLQGEGWQMIRLERRNLLRIALSWVANEQTKVVHRTIRDTARRSHPQRVPPDALLGQLERVSNDIAAEDAALRRVEYLKLYYEDDILRGDTRQAAMNRVFEHLDLPPAPVSTRYVRLTSDRLEDFVENYADVEAALRGTPYERYLHLP